MTNNESFTLSRFEFNTDNYNATRDISFLDKVKILFGIRNYSKSKKIDALLQHIMDNSSEIQSICIDINSFYITIFFKNNEIIEFWNENKWYAWGSRIYLQRYIDNNCVEKDIKIFDNVMPSRSMTIKFARFLCRYGIKF